MSRWFYRLYSEEEEGERGGAKAELNLSNSRLAVKSTRRKSALVGVIVAEEHAVFIIILSDGR